MTNSDFLIKATVKKLNEKINNAFFKKIEDAANAAQEVPDFLKKEFENLKNEIIMEASRMEQEVNEKDGAETETNLSIDPAVARNLNQINSINYQIERLNNVLEE